MIKKELETYLHTHIPISQAIGVRVDIATSQKVILTAPFDKNINHKKTVFGGSLHAVATLSCWSLLYINLQEISCKHMQIVITKSDVSYHHPVDADFQAECHLPDQDTWNRFLKMVRTKEKGRIQLSANIFHNNRLCVEYHGVFAAINE